MYSRRSQQGFTLIELLVVIAIIGIFSSIAFLATEESRTLSKVGNAKAELHQVRLAMDMYFSAVGDYPPTPPGTDHCSICYEWPPALPWANGDWLDIVTILANQDYIKDAEAFRYDPWGNSYLYDKNFRIPYSCNAPSPICSKGPNEVLETANCQATGIPVVGGDDVCIFLPK
jgi:prepilin-type N-terminal cleavage/methylation domain-containing protein